MLKELKVSNFAIIEDIDVAFNNGMTVLTGETGAGKSLIIDTISLLLGSRADSDMIRYGESKATVIGVFSSDERLNELFLKLGIKILEDITITREIYDTSKNVIKINNTNVTLVTLKTVSKYLADIHVQNDTYKLFNQEEYLSFIDPKDDSKFTKLINEYTKALYSYTRDLDNYNHILNGKNKATEKLDFLKFQKGELEALGLTIDLDKELEEKVRVLSNFDKIRENLTDAYNMLNGEMNALDMIYDASSSLDNLSDINDLYKDYSSKLLDSYYVALEIKDNISKEINSLDYNEDELNYSIELLNEINKVKDKYKKTVNELIDYLNEITLEISMCENYDDTLDEAKSLVLNSFNNLKNSAIKLTDYRKKIASKVEESIINECKDLELFDTKFNIVFIDIDYSDPFNKSNFRENGVDIIDFMISFNKGEPVKSLSKVASGGELSRVMLAFKSYLSNNSNVGLMVFDEIDTGVSGVVAKKIGNKMKSISKRGQVLCITHLPQVASSGDYHKHIYKIEENNRTKTMIKDLLFDERVEEIALMLSGDNMSIYALEHAKELLNK